MISNKILLTLAVMILAACGFHLKGTQAFGRLPYQQWHISGGEMQQVLENALRHANGQVVAAPQAQATVVIEDVVSEKNVLTVTHAALINEYVLVLRVRAQAYRAGQVWGEPILVTVRRTMDYADSEILGKQEEEATIRQEMRQDAAQQIVRRLVFLTQAKP